MAVSNNSMILIMLIVVLISTPLPTQSHNITDILSKFPDYSVYNDYLTKTKVSDEINSRQTITVLVLNNGAMSSLTADNHPLSVVKKALSLLVLLDYFDAQKLHDISQGTTLSTTLYQTTGNAHGNLGSVNITDLKGGKVGFGSATPGSKLDSTYTKSIKQIPYSLSVLEISAPVIAPGILTAPNTSAVNITGLLEKAGCKTFSSMLISSGVLKMYESSALDKGLTLFAPSDEAFKKGASGIPDLSKLSSAEIVTMLQYHALPSYTPIGTLKTSKDHPISTLATNGAKKFELSVTTAGDSVTLHTGVDSSRVAGIVIDETPLCIYTLDDILLPVELFGNGTAPSPSPSLAPEPSASDAPSSAPTPLASDSPSPAPEIADSPASGPSPIASPPAPASDSSPNGSPADSPAGDSADTTADGKNGGVIVHVSIFKTLILTVSAGALLAWNL